jgi:DNA-binding NarL/FixJ family response regulator
VAHYHGTFGAALLAAGLPGGRPPLELPLNERVDAARRMAAAGFSAETIAGELGVHAGTVGTYLRAHMCGATGSSRRTGAVNAPASRRYWRCRPGGTAGP